jgi:hypothetical protein|tara:strand:- start:5 stop:331 length:327 start_codon:yes stop_codon:yes gene_type:complete
MREFLKATNDFNGGIQKIYRFPNGLGASVIKGPYTYGGDKGLWELAVIDEDGSPTYNTSITDDVIGHLNDPQVDELLRKIKDLDGYDIECEHCGDTLADCTGYKCWIR